MPLALWTRYSCLGRWNQTGTEDSRWQAVGGAGGVGERLPVDGERLPVDGGRLPVDGGRLPVDGGGGGRRWTTGGGVG